MRSPSRLTRRLDELLMPRQLGQLGGRATAAGRLPGAQSSVSSWRTDVVQAGRGPRRGGATGVHRGYG